MREHVNMDDANGRSEWHGTIAELATFQAESGGRLSLGNYYLPRKMNELPAGFTLIGSGPGTVITVEPGR